MRSVYEFEVLCGLLLIYIVSAEIGIDRYPKAPSNVIIMPYLYLRIIDTESLLQARAYYGIRTRNQR